MHATVLVKAFSKISRAPVAEADRLAFIYLISNETPTLEATAIA
jgi:hypothetical protein